MRVCILTDTIGDLNGVSRFIQDMAEQSLYHNFNLHVISCTQKHVPVAPNIHNLHPVVRFPMPFYRELDITIPSFKTLEEKFLALAPDIVHISTPGPVGIMAKKLAQKHGLPIMGTYHTDFPAYLKNNTGLNLFKRLTDRIMAEFYRPFRHVFTRSNEDLDIMEKDIKILRSRSSYLAPGSNLERFHPRFADENVFNGFGIEGDTLKVLYVGRISKEKNIPFLLKVWETIRERHPMLDADLVLVGEGYLRKYAKKYKPLGVYFLGPVVGRTLSRLYASSDLFVFPSVTDTLGQVVMEAHASSVCSVVSDRGGPQSIVNYQNRPGGRVVRGNDTEAWVEAVVALLENATMRHHLGRQGHENMRSFSIVDSFNDFASAHMRLLQSNDQNA